MDRFFQLLNFAIIVMVLSPAYYFFKTNGLATSTAYVFIVMLLLGIEKRCRETNDRLSILYDEVNKTHQLFDRIESLREEIQRIK